MENKEYPFKTEEFGKLSLAEKIKRAYIYNNPVGTYLFTIEAGFKMSIYDRTPAMAIDPEGILCQSRDMNQWHGCRATKGVIGKGKYYYEATVTDEGLCRVGWSTQDAVHDLGMDKLGFGFGGTGKKSNGKQFDTYGEPYGKDDTIGCFIDLDTLKIKWSKNGNDFGNAYEINGGLRSYAFFPSVCMKNAEILFNFGDKSFKHPPGVSELNLIINLYRKISLTQILFQIYSSISLF